MGKLTKQIGRKPAVQRLLAALAAGFMGAVKTTTRWKTVNGGVAAAAWAGEKPVIVAFWHNRLAMMPACWPSREPFHMLISSHPDGRLIAGTVAHFGIGTVAGSSTRGGGEAVRQLLRHLKNGESIGVTPDGPRGPRMHVGDGVLMLARLSGMPILPASISVSRRKVLNTWDRLIVPLPFGHGAMIWGEPIVVPRDADETMVAALREKLTGELNRVSAEADTMTGCEVIMPAAAWETHDARA
jgi:lysophospholipid acyltransferase (LPLAT)-like uncharacterized protein